MRERSRVAPLDHRALWSAPMEQTAATSEGIESLPAERSPQWVVGLAALAIWAAMWLIAVLWGESLAKTNVMHLGAPPFAAFWRNRINGATVVSIGFGAAFIVALPWAALHLRFSAALASAGAASATFAYVLSRNDGIFGLLHGVDHNDSYFFALQSEPDIGRFVRNYVELVEGGTIAVHVRGHPPGMVVVLGAMRAIGLDDVRWVAALCIVGGGLAAIAVGFAVARLAGEHTARRALPFLALSPAALLIATTPDAFFAAVGASAVMLMAIAVTTSTDAARWWAAASGLVLGVCMMLSYGLVLISIPIAVIAFARRRWQLLIPCAICAAAFVLAWVPFGFWWLEGLAATREQYLIGISKQRPARYFSFSNIAVVGVVIGPMTCVALAWAARTWSSRRGLVLVLGGFVGAIVVANLSGMSKAEVERIWLPFTLPLLAAGSVLWFGKRPLVTARVALTVQVAMAIVLQSVLKFYW